MNIYIRISLNIFVSVSFQFLSLYLNLNISNSIYATRHVHSVHSSVTVSQYLHHLTICN